MRMGSRPCDDMFNMSQDSTGEGGALTKGVGDNKNKTSKWPDDSAFSNPKFKHPWIAFWCFALCTRLAFVREHDLLHVSVVYSVSEQRPQSGSKKSKLLLVLKVVFVICFVFRP